MMRAVAAAFFGYAGKIRCFLREKIFKPFVPVQLF